VSPNDIAAEFSRLIGRAVTMQAVPHETWEALFKAQGMTNPPRAFGCSMASTKAGSSLKAARRDQSKALFLLKRCLGNLWIDDSASNHS